MFFFFFSFFKITAGKNNTNKEMCFKIISCLYLISYITKIKKEIFRIIEVYDITHVDDRDLGDSL
jgi:hypothetical protein